MTTQLSYFDAMELVRSHYDDGRITERQFSRYASMKQSDLIRFVVDQKWNESLQQAAETVNNLVEQGGRVESITAGVRMPNGFIVNVTARPDGPALTAPQPASNSTQNTGTVDPVEAKRKAEEAKRAMQARIDQVDRAMADIHHRKAEKARELAGYEKDVAAFEREIVELEERLRKAKEVQRISREAATNARKDFADLGTSLKRTQEELTQLRKALEAGQFEPVNCDSRVVPEPTKPEWKRVVPGIDVSKRELGRKEVNQVEARSGSNKPILSVVKDLVSGLDSITRCPELPESLRDSFARCRLLEANVQTALDRIGHMGQLSTVAKICAWSRTVSDDDEVAVVLVDLGEVRRSVVELDLMVHGSDIRSYRNVWDATSRTWSAVNNLGQLLGDACNGIAMAHDFVPNY